MYHALTCIDNNQLARYQVMINIVITRPQKQNKTNNNKIQRLERGGGGVGGRVEGNILQVRTCKTHACASAYTQFIPNT